MAQYIDKDKVVTEIDKLVDKGKYNEVYDCAYRDGINAVLHILKNRLNDIEVKEFDLEKEIGKYLDVNNIEYGNQVKLFDFAKHFFELGILKTQKGE